MVASFFLLTSFFHSRFIFVSGNSHKPKLLETSYRYESSAQSNEYAGNAALNNPEDKYQLNYGTVGAASDQYCDICNFFQYSTSIMTNDTVRTTHLKDTLDLYQDIANGTLPAVAFVKPSGWVDGHPALWARPPSSSPSTKAAAIGTPATSSRSTTSARARAFL
jgi:Phosphoesterase family